MGPTPAQVTAGLVLTASRAGQRLNIPGGLDVRVGHGPSRVPDASGSTPPAQQEERTAPDLERREYERAGGGAPSERGRTRRWSVIERLVRLLRRPVSPR
jgi:hypothetical protein